MRTLQPPAPKLLHSATNTPGNGLDPWTTRVPAHGPHGDLALITGVVSGLRAADAKGGRLGLSGEWGVRFPAEGGVGFHVVLRGSGWLVADEGDPRPLRARDIIVTPSGATHGFSSVPTRLGDLVTEEMTTVASRGRSDDFEVVSGCYGVGRGRIHPFLRSMPDLLVVSPDESAQPELSLLVDLLAGQARADSGSSVTWSALIDLVLVQVFMHWQGRADSGWHATTDPVVTAVLHAIHARPEHPWTGQGLGTMAGMSRTAFSRRFTALVGEPPMRYVTRWRLTHAARLLRQTEDPLAAIARKVGYSTEFAFANAFRRMYDIAPGRFRRGGHTEHARREPSPSDDQGPTSA
jgi:AraC-like DNA-binding protein